MRSYDFSNKTRWRIYRGLSSYTDEGKELVKGDNRTSCIDIDDTEGWEDVDAIVEETEEVDVIIE